MGAHVEQELLILSEHLGSPQIFSRVRFARFSVVCVDYGLSFCLFSVVSSVIFRFTASDNPFGIFKKCLNMDNIDQF